MDYAAVKICPPDRREKLIPDRLYKYEDYEIRSVADAGTWLITFEATYAGGQRGLHKCRFKPGVKRVCRWLIPGCCTWTQAKTDLSIRAARECIRFCWVLAVSKPPDSEMLRAINWINEQTEIAIKARSAKHGSNGNNENRGHVKGLPGDDRRAGGSGCRAAATPVLCGG